MPAPIPDIIIIEPEIHEDSRGFFMETYQSELFKQAGIDHRFVQDNHSGSSQGILRGLHYQIRKPQGKLFRVISGEVFDVSVDLRRSSPTFGEWFGIRISVHNRKQLWIPAGFAHGFYVLSDWAEILYKTTDYYAPQWERTLAWDDPEIGVDWPIIKGTSPILSTKDRNGLSFGQVEKFP